MGGERIIRDGFLDVNVIMLFLFICSYIDLL